MSKYTKNIWARVGPCRSGVKFDVPHEFDVAEIGPFWNSFKLDDRIDIFCMVEAKIVAIENSDSQDLANSCIRLLNRFIWSRLVVDDLRPHLEKMGLYTSAAYVQFGKGMLL